MRCGITTRASLRREPHLRPGARSGQTLWMGETELVLCWVAGWEAGLRSIRPIELEGEGAALISAGERGQGVGAALISAE